MVVVPFNFHCNCITASSYLAPQNSIPSSVISTVHNSKAPTLCDRDQRRRSRSLQIHGRVSSSQNTTAIAAASPPSTAVDVVSAAEVVRSFYGGINARDLSSVEDLIAETCVYEDLVFPRPLVGRKEILEFFKKFNDSISSDLQFVIDDISAEDSLAVGVTWHLEWKRRPFPFSKGCSFYRLEVANGKRQIVYGRDIVEPAFKPGEIALGAIRGVTWLLEKFPQLADKL